MSRATRLAAALVFAISVGACGAGTDPDPQPTAPAVVEDAAPQQQVTGGLNATIDRAKGVADDVNSRTESLLDN